MEQTNSIPQITLDEIALEGLDGITVESKKWNRLSLVTHWCFVVLGLWKRLSIRLNLPHPLNENFCQQIWTFLLTQTKSILFYELAEPRPIIKTFDRSEVVDDTSKLSEPQCTIYAINIVNENGIRGSCQDYSTRTLIDPENVINLTLEEVGQK